MSHPVTLMFCNAQMHTDCQLIHPKSQEVCMCKCHDEVRDLFVTYRASVPRKHALRASEFTRIIKYALREAAFV